MGFEWCLICPFGVLLPFQNMDITSRAQLSRCWCLLHTMTQEVSEIRVYGMASICHHDSTASHLGLKSAPKYRSDDDTSVYSLVSSSFVGFSTTIVPMWGKNLQGSALQLFGLLLAYFERISVSSVFIQITTRVTTNIRYHHR